MSPRRADLPTLEYAVLGLIRLQPTHGYDLVHTLQQEAGIGLLWKVKPGRLYAVLERLERLGWLEPQASTGEGYVPRRAYHLTPAGEAAFQGWLHTPAAAAHRIRQEFLARLYFARHDSPQAAAAVIERQEAACAAWLAGLRRARQALTPGQEFERQVFGFRIGQVEAMQTWLQEIKNENHGRMEA